jgi:hypothetical protein
MQGEARCVLALRVHGEPQRNRTDGTADALPTIGLLPSSRLVATQGVDYCYSGFVQISEYRPSRCRLYRTAGKTWLDIRFTSR